MAALPRKGEPKDGDPSAAIDQRIADLGGWRGELLAKLREVIRAADPHITEAWKWNVPVWEREGIICTGEAYKDKVKLTFARGASVPDPKGLFNASLEGKVRRAIDFAEGDKVNVTAMKALVKAAVKVNLDAKAATR